MVFKKNFVLVIWTKVGSALEGLSMGSQTIGKRVVVLLLTSISLSDIFRKNALIIIKISPKLSAIFGNTCLNGIITVQFENVLRMSHNALCGFANHIEGFMFSSCAVLIIVLVSFPCIKVRKFYRPQNS